MKKSSLLLIGLFLLNSASAGIISCEQTCSEKAAAIAISRNCLPCAEMYYNLCMSTECEGMDF